jgi:hypothetical protein
MSEGNAANMGLLICATVAQQARRRGPVSGVAVFSTWEFSDDGNDMFWAFYLSPVAAEISLPYLQHFQPTSCGVPNDAFMLSLAYGDRRSAWDLLK